MADERGMLRALLADERLEDGERSSFEDMVSGLSLSPSSTLSRAARAAVDRRFSELGLTERSERREASEGSKVREATPVTFPWQRADGTMALPKEPPHRRKKA